MSRRPVVAFGVPVYNHESQLERSLRSVVAQTYDNFRIVIVDDASTDSTPEILQRLAAEDGRIIVIRNEERIGYTANARKCFDLCLHHFPDVEYFAWCSDHDLWEPNWLETLLKAHQDNPRCLLAWTWFHRIDGDGTLLVSKSKMLDERSAKRTGILPRVNNAVSKIPAGSALHGLFRVSALQATAGLRFVLAPDRLMMVELCLYGDFVEVPEFLWSRRYAGLVSRARQRRSSFPKGAPLYTYLPITLQHAFCLAKSLIIERRQFPEVGMGDSIRLIAAYLLSRFLLTVRRARVVLKLGEKIIGRSRLWRLAKRFAK